MDVSKSRLLHLLRLVREVRAALADEPGIAHLEDLVSKVEDEAGVKCVTDKMTSSAFLQCWLDTIDDMLEDKFEGEELKAVAKLLNKPPTQIAGVQGIAPKPITMNEPKTDVDWKKLVRLPPFQMFAAERMRNTSGKDSQEHASDYVRAQGGGADVFQAYCQWHKAKGYWKNETPMGEVRYA